MNQAHMTDGFAHVSDIFEKFCAEQAINILGKAVEKHGSWEWSGCRTGEINRYVSLALTSEHENFEGSDIYVVEVWAEADDDSHFTRRLSSTFRISEPLMIKDSLDKQLGQALAASWKQAQLMSSKDLTGTYIR